jgi:choline kinase
MKIIILAAGQGTRLRPLTDKCPKCMVEVKGKSIIDRQIASINSCGINDEDIYIVTGYCGAVLEEHFKGREIHFIHNKEFDKTNMVCSLMCASDVMKSDEDIIVSYGDIIYNADVFQKILLSKEQLSVIVDDGWYDYWSDRCENPLSDAESLIYDELDNLVEIGQKTNDLSRVQSQYIGLMRFQKDGITKVLNIAEEAKLRSSVGKKLWRTTRTYQKMYMTDLLQGLIDEGNKLKAVHINRGWYEIDNCDDLGVVEKQLAE